MDPRRPAQPGCARRRPPRSLRQRDVATTSDLAPLTNGTSGGDVDLRQRRRRRGVRPGWRRPDPGQRPGRPPRGQRRRRHDLGQRGSATTSSAAPAARSRTTSRRPSTGRIDNATGDDAANDVLHGGDGLGGVASGDDDVVIGDNGTSTACSARPASATPSSRLPFNGDVAARRRWDEPNILRVVRLLDVATTGERRAGDERHERRRHDQRRGRTRTSSSARAANDTISGDDADLDGADPGDAGATTTSRATAAATRSAATSARTTSPAAARRRTASSTPTATARSTRPARGETLRDAGDLIAGDSGDADGRRRRRGRRRQRPHPAAARGRRRGGSTPSARTSTPSRSAAPRRVPLRHPRRSAAPTAARPTRARAAPTRSPATAARTSCSARATADGSPTRLRHRGRHRGAAELPDVTSGPGTGDARGRRGIAERRRRRRRPARPERPAVPRDDARRHAQRRDRRGLHRGQPGLGQRVRRRGRGRRGRRLLGEHGPPQRDPAAGRPRRRASRRAR